MSDARQLLGMKGASGTSNIWKLRLQLMKPVTWIPLIWGVVCGAAASGNYEWRLDHVGAALACMVMSGPLLAGYTQTITELNDHADSFSVNSAEINHGAGGVFLEEFHQGTGNAIADPGDPDL